MIEVVFAGAVAVLLAGILLRMAWWAARGGQGRQLGCFLASWLFLTIVGAVVYTVALVYFKRKRKPRPSTEAPGLGVRL